MASNAIQYQNITVPLPDGWEDGTQLVALGKPDGRFRPNMVASQEPAKPGETTAQFAARTLSSLQRELPGYRLVREGDAQFGPNTGFLREHEFTTNGPQLAQLQFYVVLWEICFTCTFTHLADKFAGERATAEKMFAQTQFKPPVSRTPVPITRDDDFYSS